MIGAKKEISWVGEHYGMGVDGLEAGKLSEEAHEKVGIGRREPTGRENSLY